MARLGLQARATKDVDTTWRSEKSYLDNALNEAASLILSDQFIFEFSVPRPLVAEGPEGGLRYAVTSYLAGRVFEQLTLDINLVPDDFRSIEQIDIVPPVPLPGLDYVRTWTIPIGQHLAEKIHAYTRSYSSKPNNRVKDLYDMLVIAEELPLPCLGELANSCRETFGLRKTDWPPSILYDPPSDWTTAWSSYVDEYKLRHQTLTEAGTALRLFWLPVFEVQQNSSTFDFYFKANEWSWRAASNL